MRNERRGGKEEEETQTGLVAAYFSTCCFCWPGWLVGCPPLCSRVTCPLLLLRYFLLDTHRQRTPSVRHHSVCWTHLEKHKRLDMSNIWGAAWEAWKGIRSFTHYPYGSAMTFRNIANTRYCLKTLSHSDTLLFRNLIFILCS